MKSNKFFSRGIIRRNDIFNIALIGVSSIATYLIIKSEAFKEGAVCGISGMSTAILTNQDKAYDIAKKVIREDADNIQEWGELFINSLNKEL